MQQRIVCAAIRDQAGVIVCSARHFDALMRDQVARLTAIHGEWEQGFIDQRGNFFTRETALIIAINADQIIRRAGNHPPTQLFSEHLY